MTVVREVSARLGADVDGYVRDIRRAGRETDRAFASMTANVRAVNRELGVTDIRTRNADAATRQLTDSIGQLQSRLGQLPTTLTRSSDGVRRLGADVGQLDTRLSSVATQSEAVDRGLRDIGASARTSVRDVRVADRGINDLTGRLRALTKLGIVGGPGLIPVGAVGLAGLVGLANQLGVLAAAGGSVILAFQGVGDAVTAVNDFALEPTADNALKAQQALDRLSPAAEDFVNRLSELRSVGGDLRDAASEGFFPGATRGLDELETLAPRVQNLVAELGDAAGDILGDAGESLASGRWTDFLDYLEQNGRGTLEDLASAAGSAAHGVSELIMAMDPTNDGFGDWLAERANTFDAWASGLENSEGAQKFMAYVAETGPQVSDTIGAIANALAGIVSSAAPLGGPVLKGIEIVADALGLIADSPIGDKVFTFAAAFVALNSALAITSRLAGSLGFAGIAGALGAARPIARGANAIAPIPTRPAAAAPAAPVAPVPGFRSGPAAAATSSTAALAAAQGRAAGAAAGLTSESDKQGRSLGALGRTAGLAAAGTAAFALATTDTGRELGLTNTAMLGLVGAMVNPFGAAIGASIGMLADAKAANEDLSTSYENLANAIDVGAPMAQQEAAFAAAEEQLANYERRVDGVFGNGGFGDFSKLEGPGDFFSGAVGGIASLWGGGLAKARDELRELRQEMDWAAEGEQVMGDLFGDSINVSTDGIRAATDDINELRAAFADLQAELTGRSAWRDYEAALDAVDASIRDNGRSLDVTTEKGRANAAALDGIAASSLAVAENLEGMERLRFLERARGDFVDAAQKFDMTKREANQLADELGLLDNLIIEPPKVKNGDALPRFRGDVDKLRRSYESMPQSVRTAMLLTGVPKSKREAQQLGRQYDLTPRQIRTLVRLSAAGALRGISNVDQLLTQLDGESARTRVEADVDKAIRGVGRTGTLVGNLGRQVAKPKADLNNQAAVSKSAGLQKMLQYLSGMRPTPMAGLNDRASGPIRGIQGLLNSIDGRHTSSTHTHTNTVVNRTVNQRGNAEGGLYRSVRYASYAEGGFNTYAGTPGGVRDPRDVANGHSPQRTPSRTGGLVRVWGEEEAGGEVYLPLANDYRRPRARNLLEETAALYGGQVVWNAEGGMYRANSMNVARRASAGIGGRGGPLELRGWLDTPWGPAEVRAISRDEAENVVAGAARESRRRSYAESTTWYDEEG